MAALQLNDVIAAIPAASREVIVLREMEGLSYKEIATVVDAPIGTVISRLPSTAHFGAFSPGHRV